MDQPLQAAKTALDLSAIKISGDSKIRETPLGWIILLGFLGGLILNLMPCVLPGHRIEIVVVSGTVGPQVAASLGVEPLAGIRLA